MIALLGSLLVSTAVLEPSGGDAAPWWRRPGLQLLAEPPPPSAPAAPPPAAWLLRGHRAPPPGSDLPVVWVLPEACEAYAVGDAAGAPGADNRRGGQRVSARDVDAPRTLLRLVAREGARPALDWATGRSALRVLERAFDAALPAAGGAGGVERAALVDLLLSVRDDELDEVEENVRCGVGGEARRRADAREPLLAFSRVAPGDAVVLPERCRCAARALPASRVAVLWRAARRDAPAVLERCAASEDDMYWVDAADGAAAAAAAARVLPRGAGWVAGLQLSGAEPSADDARQLADAPGCRAYAACPDWPSDVRFAGPTAG